jgi:hypothetical protein
LFEEKRIELTKCNPKKEKQKRSKKGKIFQIEVVGSLSPIKKVLIGDRK